MVTHLESSKESIVQEPGFSQAPVFFWLGFVETGFLPSLINYPLDKSC